MLRNMDISQGLWRRRVAGLLVLTGLAATAACGSDEQVDPPCPKLVHIDKTKIEPALTSHVLMNRAGLGVFDVRTAPSTVCIDKALHYSWYGDYDETSGIPLPFYHACGSSPLCTLAPCKALVDPQIDQHSLLLVVSEEPLPANAPSPFNFPADVAFDFVQWDIRLLGECP